jgi:hypothetical protein
MAASTIAAMLIGRATAARADGCSAGETGAVANSDRRLEAERRDAVGFVEQQHRVLFASQAEDPGDILGLDVARIHIDSSSA